MEKIKVVELFAGVGGFRLGLERYNKDLFDFVFANQWEPGKKVQHAYDCYINHFGSENVSNEDITIAKYDIPDDIDLLVGGFPCQDYSVAATKAKGIQGKKGVLWWEISWILEHKKPKMVLLENVDRLLKSPASQRGRDFAIMLMNMHKNGYDVEWQVINAAEYGMVQRRRRVFIFAKRRDEFGVQNNEEFDILNSKNNSFFYKPFPYEINEHKNETIDLIKFFKDEVDITENFNKGKFLNKGFCINGIVYHFDYDAINSNEVKVLGDILESNVDKKYYLDINQLNKMKYLKGSKKIERYKPNGELYYYSEGKMSLDDKANLPGRTMLTSEGTLNRSTHIVKEKTKYRFITPLEAERLNGFDDNWTKSIPTDRMRYFCMGNALVVDIIEKFANEIRNSFKHIGKNMYLTSTDILSKKLKKI